MDNGCIDIPPPLPQINICSIYNSLKDFTLGSLLYKAKCYTLVAQEQYNKVLSACYVGILRDKTMDEKLMLIHDNDKQNYSFCRLKSFVESLNNASFNQLINNKSTFSFEANK